MIQQGEPYRRNARRGRGLNATFTVRRIMGIKGWKPEWTVDSVWENGKVSRITGTEIRDMFRAAVKSIGEEELGFKASEVGTHSNRSAAAMAMKAASGRSESRMAT